MGFEKKLGENSKQVIDSDVGSFFVPNTVSYILTEASMILDFSEKMSRLDFYVQSLEEEMRKIHVFKRELPLSMHLLKDAIETLKKEMLMCEEKERKTVPVKEFIPLKSDSSSENGRAKPSNHINEAKNWMSSVHLWITPVQYEDNNNLINTQNQDSVLSSKSKYKEEESSESQSILFKNREGGAFSPFKKPTGVVGVTIKEDKNAVPKVNGGLTLSIPVAADVEKPIITTTQDSIVKEAPHDFTTKPKPHQPHQDEQQRKQRRCWSPELHRIFVDALDELGGAKVATPKQIRELMKVEGLTNDEVKSHLQKYRLHVRKVSRSTSVPMGLIPWFRPDYEHGESSNNINNLVAKNSLSPQQHLHDDVAGGPTSAAQGGSSTTTEGDIIEEADEDEKSKSYNWKGKSAEHPF